MAHARDFAENVVGRVVSSARRGRLTFIAQMAASDCGPACLAMTLGLFGKRLPLNEIRKVVGPVTGGVTMAQLLTAGSELGLIGRGVRLDLDDLVEMSPGTILHWNMNHFVVLRGATRKTVEVLDPALGVRKLSYEEVGQEFTGVALCFTPSPEFVPERARERPLWPHFKHILVHRKGLIATLLGALAIQTMGLLTPAALAFAVEDLIPWHRKDMLLPLAGALGVSAVFFFWASYVRARILASIHIQVARFY